MSISLCIEDIAEGNEADIDGIVLREGGHIKVPKLGYTIMPTVVQTILCVKSGTKPKKRLAL